ncbi:MAG: hypothetical protein JNK82_35030, partial [Myxococcaceae bacterium]|nr:hypothetical protein [Myxococcaceae bacterium]
MRRLVLTLLACSAAACRCAPPPINMVETGFRVEEMELDFGRVRENTTATRDVHIVATGLGALTLSLTTVSPFSARAMVELEGGGRVTVPVNFHAADLPVEGELVVSSMGGEVKVKLKGVGVRPLDCVPSAPCRTSVYVLETHTCSETVVPDGEGCTPTSTCLEQGQCLAGLCQGVARSCDDNNRCTNDGCAEGMGCLNPPRQCPPPSAPCRVAVCDPGTGCGEAVAPDGTRCGPVDCERARVCFAGSCVEIETPEGFTPCSPPTPCQGAGSCLTRPQPDGGMRRVCVRPDAGVMQPDLSIPVGGVPSQSRPMLLSFAGQLYGERCGLPLPRVPLDGGLSEDGGALDGGFADGGFGCALFSYTGNGFERFTARFPDERERALVHVANSGVGLLDDGGLELRRLDDGGLWARHELPGLVSTKGVASSARGLPWVLAREGDAGSVLARVEDGGLVTVASLDASVDRLALDENGNVWVAGELVAGFIEAGDGGLLAEPRWFVVAPSATDTLATASGFAVTGSTQFIASASDGGLVASPAWLDDAGQPLRVHERFNLAAQGRAIVFYGQCPVPMMSCPREDDQLRLRAFSMATGGVDDDVAIGPPRFAAQVVEATTLELPGFDPAVAALVQLHSDSGVASAYLQLTVGSQGDLTCPLPPNSDVAAASMGSGIMWVYLSRDGGTYRLESYPLTGLPLGASGWPLAEGTSG